MPEPCFTEAALAEGGGAIEELGADLIAIVNGVVEALLQVLFGERLDDVVDVEEVLRGVFRNGRSRFAGLRGGNVEDVENEYRIVGDDGAAGFGDQIRMG